MRRDPGALTGATFDLVVVGAGIYGACAAWDASQRGLSVALLDAADFGGATSANSQKLIHGGLRYLQKAQLRRMRESIRERRAFLHIAPRLVHPLECVVPAYGHGVHGPEALRAALALNDVLSRDRNRGLDGAPVPAESRIPPSRVLSREALLRRFPDLASARLTGGAAWTDALMRSSERLTLAFVLSAAAAGAAAVNYVRALSPMVSRGRGGSGRVAGVEARDELDGRELEVRAAVVLNAAGPWTGELARAAGGAYPAGEFRLARGFNVVVDRALGSTAALGVPGRAAGDVQSGGGGLVRRLAGADRRFFFLTPWRNRTVVGTSYLPHEGPPEAAVVTPAEVVQLLARVNEAWPAAELRPTDVTAVQCGLLPVRPGTAAVEVADDHRLYDASLWGGPDGLVTLRGVKYTTARAAAEQAVDLVCGKLRADGASRTAVTPLRFATLTPAPEELADPELPAHGSWTIPPDQVAHAVRHEAAVRLADLVRRRTDLAAAGPPAPGALEDAADQMGRELGWDEARRRREEREVRGLYAPRDSPT